MPETYDPSGSARAWMFTSPSLLAGRDRLGRGGDDWERGGAVLAEQEADFAAVLVLDGAGMLDGAGSTAEVPHWARLEGIAEILVGTPQFLHLDPKLLVLLLQPVELLLERWRLLFPDSLGRRGFGFVTRHQSATTEPQQRRNQRHCDERGRIPPKGRQSHVNFSFLTAVWH